MVHIIQMQHCSCVLFQEKPEYNEPPPTPILYQVALGLGYLELPQGTKSLYVPNTLSFVFDFFIT